MHHTTARMIVDQHRRDAERAAEQHRLARLVPRRGRRPPWAGRLP
ncbi:hypothetical protein [Saccharothrix sp. Mg75]